MTPPAGQRRQAWAGHDASMAGDLLDTKQAARMRGVRIKTGHCGWSPVLFQPHRAESATTQKGPGLAREKARRRKLCYDVTTSRTDHSRISTSAVGRHEARKPTRSFLVAGS